MKIIYQIIVAFVTLYLGSVFEPLFFPVVMNWTPTSMVKNSNGEFIMKGFMTKVRGCKFIAAQVTDNNKMQLPLKFLDNVKDDQESRPTGTQPWGIWRVILRPDTSIIKIHSLHECHPLWTTKTLLGEINVYKTNP